MTTLQSLVIIDVLIIVVIITFNLSSDFVLPRGQMVMCHNGWVLLIISHCPVKFGGQRLCGIGDIKLLICQSISRDHVIRGSSGWILLIINHYPAIFCGNKPCRRVDIVFHWSCDPKCHMINGLCGIMAGWLGVSHPKSPPPGSYVSICWKYMFYL